MLLPLSSTVHIDVIGDRAPSLHRKAQDACDLNASDPGTSVEGCCDHHSFSCRIVRKL